MKADLNNPLSRKGLPKINFESQEAKEISFLNTIAKKQLNKLRKQNVKIQFMYVGKDLNNIYLIM